MIKLLASVTIICFSLTACVTDDSLFTATAVFLSPTIKLPSTQHSTQQHHCEQSADQIGQSICY